MYAKGCLSHVEHQVAESYNTPFHSLWFGFWDTEPVRYRAVAGVTRWLLKATEHAFVGTLDLTWPVIFDVASPQRVILSDWWFN